MKEYFIRITPDNRVKIIDTEAPTDYRFYADAIGARIFEIVRFGKRTNQVLVVNEESLLHEKPQPNVIASLLAERPIFDTVLIATEDIRDGEPDLLGFQDAKHAIAARIALHIAIMHTGIFEGFDTVD